MLSPMSGRPAQVADLHAGLSGAAGERIDPAHRRHQHFLLAVVGVTDGHNASISLHLGLPEHMFPATPSSFHLGLFEDML